MNDIVNSKLMSVSAQIQCSNEVRVHASSVYNSTSSSVSDSNVVGVVVGLLPRSGIMPPTHERAVLPDATTTSNIKQPSSDEGINAY